MTIEREHHPGNSLKEKMKMFVQPKCYPILFDGNINSKQVVLINIYQVFLLCAIKFHCVVKSLKKKSNEHFFFSNVINEMIVYFNSLILSRINSLQVRNFFPVLIKEFSFRDVKYLALFAFHLILNKKQTRYLSLLSYLSNQICSSFTTQESVYYYSIVTNKRNEIFK